MSEILKEIDIRIMETASMFHMKHFEQFVFSKIFTKYFCILKCFNQKRKNHKTKIILGFGHFVSPSHPFPLTTFAPSSPVPFFYSLFFHSANENMGKRGQNRGKITDPSPQLFS